jgi:hypothetical protein
MSTSAAVHPGGDASVAAVMDNDDMRREVLSRLDSVRAMTVMAMVSKTWMSTVSARAFADEFKRRCSPPLLGFITVYERHNYKFARFAPMPGLVGALEEKASPL